MSEEDRRTYPRRTILGGMGALTAGLALGACGSQEDRTPTPVPSSPTTAASTPPEATPTTPSPATPENASIEEMVGQMLMLGFRGQELTPDNPIVADIRERHLGSVVLFSFDVPGSTGRNIGSPEQLTALCAALQAEARVPLLIATDQEGGEVARLDPEHGFPATYSAAELGARNDPAFTRTAAADMAQTLTAAGINLNLAPVVDVNTNPDNPIIGAFDRSFSPDPRVVAEQASAFIEGHHATGVLTTLKHFPGHGSSHDDSHAGFVDVTDSWTDLELDPYRALIGSGQADAVMAAHVFNANLDPVYPASLSQQTITGILREQLGFDGVVISDDLRMGAIVQEWGFEEAIRLAVLAGTDILAYSNNLVSFEATLGTRAYNALLAMVNSGEISETRIAESYGRIMRLKARLKTA